jgi:hypothetical protein
MFTWTEYNADNGRKSHRLLDDGQRIVGRIVEYKVPGGGREYDAHCYLRNNYRLGRDLTLDLAKQQVERQARTAMPAAQEVA